MLIKLNDAQKKAASSLKGNLLIVASAGTGKTTTIIERYFNLLQEGIMPSQIMMTTFTNKSAKDIIKKINERGGKISPYIGTMHSLFLKILRIHFNLISDKPFVLLSDEEDKKKIIKEILTHLNLDHNSDAIKYFSNWISKYKNRGIFAEELSLDGTIDELKESGRIPELLDDEIIFIDPKWRKNVNKVYKHYQDYLNTNYLLDFDEILMKTYNLFNNHPSILNNYKNNFKSIMVDEAQDLNVIQKKIIDQLAEDNLCLIGDDCQNIFEWRGSSNEFIFDFNEMKNSITLEENYRSTQNIINAVNKTIDSLKFKIDKKIKCTNSMGEKIIITNFQNINEEVFYISNQIEELIHNGEKYSDITILFRTNFLGKVFERELRKRKIPCHLAKSVDFFSREEIKDIVSILRLKVNPYSLLDFERIYKIIPRFGKNSFDKIKSFIFNNRISFKEVVLNLDEFCKKDTIYSFIKILFNKFSPNNLHDLLNSLGYYSYLEKKYSKDPQKLEEKMENISILQSLFESDQSILSFLDSLQEIEKKEVTEDKISLSTIHSSKGLEWKHVFLVCCNEGILPYHNGSISQIKKDSETRLFYVAISRAKEKLIISSHKENNGRNYSPSEFLKIIQ